MSGRATKAEELEAEWLAAAVRVRRHELAGDEAADIAAEDAARADKLWKKLEKIHGAETGKRLLWLAVQEYVAEGLE